MYNKYWFIILRLNSIIQDAIVDANTKIAMHIKKPANHPEKIAVQF